MAVIDDFFGKNKVQQNKVKRRATQPKPSARAAAATSATGGDERVIKKPKLELNENSNDATQKLSAEDVLKTIPDLDLDSVDIGSGKFSFANKQDDPSSSHNDFQVEALANGRENCLNGLTIVFTGNLPTIDRDHAVQLAKRYGAKVTSSISKNTSLVVIGTGAGPSKISKIKSLGTKCVNEDGFVELISKMPADGGAGEKAQKELAKKREEERKVEMEIEEEIAKEKKQQQEEKRKRLDVAMNSPGLSSSGSAYVKPPVDRSTQLWTDRYAPTDMKQICGNKGNVEMLYNWLATWFDKPHDMKGSSIDAFKAVLISGPPGIGKTTAATLLSKKLGYDVIEKNASDFRSKKVLNDSLKVSLDNTSVAGFFKHEDHTATTNNKKIVLLMDEVDGMSSGDNGGVAQLTAFCRETKTPMILICNDKSLPKMRTLDRCCFDLVWRRPSAREMKSRLMTIAHREGLKLDPNIIDKLVSITHNDIRQIINIMSTVARTQKSLNFDNLNDMQDSWEKEVSLKPFDVIPRLLSVSNLSINEKIGLYFNDMDIIPLMVHENYKLTKPIKAGNNNLKHLKQLSIASDLISESDHVNSLIRSGEQQWSLLPFHAIMSTVYPAFEVAGQIAGRINFTSWLGQNSKRMKFDRIVQNLQYHSCIKTGTNNIDLRLDYVPFLREKLIKPLVDEGLDGISTVLELMDEYYLTKEDFDNILELSVHGSMKVDDKYKKVPTKVKSAFTRKYNSYLHPTVIYKTGDSVSKGRGKKSSTHLGEFGEEEGDGLEADADADADTANGEDDENGNQDISKDSLIKTVIPKSTKKVASKKAKK